MKKILQISLLILILQVSAYSQDSLRIGWQGELLTTKGKISKMNFYRFVRETDDSIYFLTSGKDNEVYLNSFSRKSKNTDDPILLNPTPLNLPVIKKGELYDPGEATFGGNILLAFKVQSSDMISLTFILLDQQGNLIKNTTIDLPTSGSLFYKENIFLKIVFSQDKKRLLVIHSSCEKDKTIANKLLVFDQDLNQVADLNNFALACNPKYTIDKPINTQLVLQTEITNSGFVIIRHAQVNYNETSDRTVEIYNAKNLTKIRFDPDLEGFVIRGDIKILDENETGLKITGIYGSNVEPKGIFFCELDNSMKLIEKPKLVPFLNLNDSIKQTVTDVKICGIKKMLNDEILILTEDEFRAQQKFTISGGGPSGSMSVIISYEWQLQKNMVSCWLVNNKKELVRIFTNSKQQSRNLYESPYRETFIGTNTYFTDSLIYLTNVDNDLKINNYLAIVNSSVALDKINFTNRAINSKKINFLNSKKSGFIQSIDYFEKRDLFWGKDCIYIRKTDTKGRILIGTLEY